MKKLLICLAVVLSIFVSSSVVFAGSGSAIVPHWLISKNSDGSSHHFTSIYLSNISDNNVDIAITFYDVDGDVLQDSTSSSTGGYIRGNENFTGYTETTITGDPSVTFTMAAHETCRLQTYPVSNNDSDKGYALIEWTNSTKDVNALVSHAYYLYSANSVRRSASIPINNGLPF